MTPFGRDRQGSKENCSEITALMWNSKAEVFELFCITFFLLSGLSEEKCKPYFKLQVVSGSRL